MRKRRKLCGVLLIVTALVLMMLPVSEADAAASASDFKMEGSTLVKYRGSDKNVSVPDTVEVIGEGAFEENKNVELVVLPNSVKRIEGYAFWGCDRLDTVVLGKGLTQVEEFAFAGCKGLKQMTIPANVTSIGNQAFGDCVNLKDISIPPETTQIAESAFEGCYQLTIHCEAGSPADTYAQAFYERQKEMPEYEDVPDYAPEDQDSAASDPTSEPGEESSAEPAPTPVPEQQPSGGESVLGSSWVVGNRAFVYIPTGNLQVLGGNAGGTNFGTGDGQGSVGQTGEIPAAGSLWADNLANGGLAKYTVVDGQIVADQAYYGNRGLGSVVLPEGIREIGQFSFARSSITDVVIPEGVTDIGYGAFYHCDSLTGVTLPGTVRNVEPKAFENTAWLKAFLESGEEFLISGGVLVAYGGEGAAVTVPDGVRVIGAEAFAGHGEIQSVTLPDSLQVIGEGAFENCGKLVQVDLGGGVEEIKDRAFFGCGISEAGAFRLPASVRKIGLRAFDGVELQYEGEMPEVIHEASAERLSNESYRGLGEEGGENAGVTLIGSEGAAHLEGAARSYTLTVSVPEDTQAMETACQRSFQSAMPENMTVYDLTLTDASGIPLTKLGKRLLTVVLPVPENLAGQKLSLITLDRNGQPEALAVERVSLNGTEAFQFKTDHLSLFGVYGLGQAEAGEELREVDVTWADMSAGPQGAAQRSVPWAVYRLLAGGILCASGLFLLLTMGEKRHQR
ncbi:MAG: leucine-rich repeat domain-containing protein [Acetatifactor sp.]|nr:leucine-rich repeat domain-containing protein [Acetatifactor sp.]